jgi:hypothetical protein
LVTTAHSAFITHNSNIGGGANYTATAAAAAAAITILQ